MSRLDVERAALALVETGSRFFAHAADWLVHLDDPVPLLLVLTKETGPALGPWATYRMSALLGLSSVGAVRALAADIASEAPDHPLVAVDAAFAKAHARASDAALDIAHTDTVVAMLARTDHDDTRAARAALALTGLVEPDEDSARLTLDDDGRLAVRADVVLEAALLAPRGARDAHVVERALSALAARQRDDGLVASSSGRPRDDRFTTLRALALTTRLARERT